MRRKVTEGDVVLAHMDFIQEVAQLYGNGLEPADCMSIGAKAFLKAVRTYRYGYVSFLEYARGIIRREIAKETKYHNYIRQAESRLSMDMMVGGEEKEQPVGNFLNKKFSGDFTTIVFLRDFLSVLPMRERKVAGMLIDRYTLEEICQYLYLREDQLMDALAYLRFSWLCYDEEPNMRKSS